MALLTLDELRAHRNVHRKSLSKSAAQIIAESKPSPLTKEFDIFLSHASIDIEDVLSLRELLASCGFTAFVDRFEDTDLDQSITFPTAPPNASEPECGIRPHCYTPSRQGVGTQYGCRGSSAFLMA